MGVLLAAGFDVPDGFVVTVAAFETVLQAPALAARVAAVETALVAGELPDESTLAALREAILAVELPPALRQQLAEAYGALANPRVAVRSSGSREDLDDASFAGQYETYLNVRGEVALERALKQCWASLWQSRVLQYASRHREGASGLRMAVVVQEMAAAEVAGVAFTVNPLTGRQEEMLVEAVFGLGESLVSGRANADRFVLAAANGDVMQQELAAKTLQVVPVEIGVEERQVEGEEATRVTLTGEELRKLAQVSADIQEHYGRPMDIEWSFAAGRLYILQARPITHLAFAAEIGQWTTADFRDGGVSSEVCSPFMWSLYELALQSSMPTYFKALKLIPQDHEATWARMFFGRPYWNLSEVKLGLERIPGYSEDSFHADLGVDVDREFEGKKTRTTVTGVLRALPTLFALKRNYRERLGQNQAFLTQFEERKAPFDISAADIAALDDEAFLRSYAELIEDLYRDTETSYFYTIYNTSNSKLDFKPCFEKVNALAGGSLDEPTLLTGLQNLSHLRPMKDLHAVVEAVHQRGGEIDDALVAEFAHRWRHHGRRELDIRVPRWDQDHDYVRDMLEAALEHHDAERDPAEVERRHVQAHSAALSTALAPLRWRPLLRRSFIAKLELVRRYAWWREEMRDCSSFLYYLVRQWTVDAARRLVAADMLASTDSIWALSFTEVLQALRGALSSSEVKARAACGERMMRSYRNFANPNEIGSHFRFAREQSPPTEGALRGTPCSPGRVTGRARIIGSLEEAHSLEPGDILVTRFTDPGWTPLFGRIRAVVTETGGVLSHAAVISREYGIPAVLAVSGATEAIVDGTTITVDGCQGIVDRGD